MYLYASFYNISSLLLPYQHQRPWSSQLGMKTYRFINPKWGESRGGGGRAGGDASKFPASEAFHKIKATHFISLLTYGKKAAEITTVNH